MPTTKQPATRTGKASEGFTDEERLAMQERAREAKAASRRGADKAAEAAAGEAEVLAKLADMPAPDRAMGERLHAIVLSSAPNLAPRTYYGMPAYAKDGKVICFFKPASKFKVRYATFEFQPDAVLDDGAMWPVAFALIELTAAAEARIAELVRKAAS